MLSSHKVNCTLITQSALLTLFSVCRGFNDDVELLLCSELMHVDMCSWT